MHRLSIWVGQANAWVCLRSITECTTRSVAGRIAIMRMIILVSLLTSLLRMDTAIGEPPSQIAKSIRLDLESAMYADTVVLGKVTEWDAKTVNIRPSVLSAKGELAEYRFASLQV